MERDRSAHLALHERHLVRAEPRVLARPRVERRGDGVARARAPRQRGEGRLDVPRDDDSVVYKKELVS